ncbi:MAG: prephenate dehydratase [Phycisphaerales bacterium]|nr:prephenate dehydratase [Phycisphaerales bacterium]
MSGKSSKNTNAAETQDSGDARSESVQASQDLGEFRVQIDQIDQRLVDLLNERAKLVVEVGTLKRGSDTPIYAPHREAQVLEKAIDRNEGPLPDRTIEGIYRELMSGSFALEHPLRIGYLGPPGSYSHQASVKQFGSSVDYENLQLIGGVFTEVRRGHVNYGLVPIENSIGGGITETLDALASNAGHVWVYAEAQIAIKHMLLTNCKPHDVRRIHSKPEVFAQCRNWLTTQYPNAALLPDASTSQAVKTAIKENQLAVEIGAEPGSAAIASELAGELYGLPALFTNIADNPDNITRFYIISKEKALATGDDKTSIMFATEDKPGALVEVLQAFHSEGVNLSHIDKRPSGRENWSYAFYIDALGHSADESMRRAIANAQEHCKELHVLGSYPRSKRIL